MAAKVCTHPWEFRLAPFRIAANLYYVGNRSVSSHLVDTGDGLILFDTTFPQTFYLVVQSIHELGFAPRDIRWVLHSHAHYDHIGGTCALRSICDPQIAIGEADADLIVHRPELTETDLYGFTFYEQFTADRRLRDGDMIELGTTRVTAIHTAGHTPGTMSYVFNLTTDDGRVLRAGFQGGPGLATLTDEYLAKFDLPVSLRDDYLAGVRRLRREAVDIHLSTHPSQSEMLSRARRLADDPDAFIDPERWPRYLDQLEHAFDQRFRR